MEPIQRIAVIGAGRIGREFALHAVKSGFAVALEDVMPEKLRRAQDAYAELRGEPSGAGSLRFATEVEDAVRDADLAIDFVPDELESKLEIFSLLDRMAPPRTILCTPTDALSITDLASCTYRAGQCVAVSAEFSELLRSRFVTEAVMTAVSNMFAQLGMTLRECADRDVELVKNAAL
jgi:3-hydroxybutyryl-CoA dehydrogenase